MLQVRNLSVEVGGRYTLTDGSFSLRAGDKAGLVGRNGAGKTSLLKVLGGENEAAGGVIMRGERVGYLPQDPKARGAGIDSTALSHVLSGRGLDEAARRIEKLHAAVEEDPSERNIHRFTNAEEEFRSAGGYSAEAEVRSLAAGLGLSDDRLDLPLTVLSGGERRRVELARILFAGSDLLMLDEPTNHLDIDAKEWLMGFLRSYRGALLVVSHDLELLDEAITRVLHLDEGEVIEYRGTYSQYEVARVEDEARRAKVAAREATERTRLTTLADSMRGQTAKRARVAKSLDKRVARLDAGSAATPTKTNAKRTISVRLPNPPAAGKVVLEAKELAKAYGGPTIFEDVSFDVGRGERLLVLGLNGAGKTSLIRVLAGEIEPELGSVTLGKGVSLGYFAQEHETIKRGETVLEHLRSATPELGDQERRNLLGSFGLPGDMAFQDAGTLSGGEKTKLALSMLVGGQHNLLLLDEPTNNLDPPSRTAIGNALRTWKGTLIFVSHDTEFVRALSPDRMLLMPDGTLDYWNDDLIELVALA
jgi:ATPase subunit of ABC transporter with duplicated ATPase domains